jgi:hypothetical protein
MVGWLDHSLDQPDECPQFTDRELARQRIVHMVHHVVDLVEERET